MRDDMEVLEGGLAGARAPAAEDGRGGVTAPTEGEDVDVAGVLITGGFTGDAVDVKEGVGGGVGVAGVQKGDLGGGEVGGFEIVFDIVDGRIGGAVIFLRGV